MAAPLSGRARRSREAEAQKAKAKREKVILAVGGAVLLILLVVELPGTLKQLSGGSHPAAAPQAATSATTVPAAVPLGVPSGVSGGGAVTEPRDVQRFSGKDVFKPQVSASAATTTPTTGGAPVPTSAGPAVRLTGFVAKNVFVAQVHAAAPVSTPAATAAASPVGPTVAPIAGSNGATTPTSNTLTIVVLGSAKTGDAAASAKRQEVAAQNLGLQNVHVTSLKGVYTIYTGPYRSSQVAAGELARARRVGYATATTKQLSHAKAGF